MVDMFRSVIAVVVFGLPSASLPAQAKKESPKEAKTTADILKAVDAIKGFGTVSSAEFGRADGKMFFAWYCPYSGRAACHVHGYTFDAKKERWLRTLDRVFEGTADVSVEVGAAVKIRDMQGKVVFEQKRPN
jgi:hypothetical protein